MSLMSHKSPILSGLSTRRKHHIHTVPAEKKGADSAATEKRGQPFGELKFDAENKPATAPAYKSIFSL